MVKEIKKKIRNKLGKVSQVRNFRVDYEERVVKMVKKMKVINKVLYVWVAAACTKENKWKVKKKVWEIVCNKNKEIMRWLMRYKRKCKWVIDIIVKNINKGDFH